MVHLNLAMEQITVKNVDCPARPCRDFHGRNLLSNETDHGERCRLFSHRLLWFP